MLHGSDHRMLLSRWIYFWLIITSLSINLQGDRELWALSKYIIMSRIFVFIATIYWKGVDVVSITGDRRDRRDSRSPSRSLVTIMTNFWKNRDRDVNQSWNRCDFFRPDRTGQSGFFDQTGSVGYRPVQTLDLTGKKPVKNRPVTILDFTGVKPVHFMHQLNNQYFQGTVF